MTATDTEARTDWAQTARLLGEQFAPDVARRERDGAPPYAELQAIRESGLVNLLIAREYGGAGGSYLDAARVISELAAVDPNIGALFAYHVTNFIPSILDYDGDNAALQRRSAEQRWLWGNVTQPWVPFRADPTPDGGFVLNGVKPMNTGAITGDVSTVLVPRSDRRDFVYLAVPRDREGQTFHDDWDAFGLRRTATVTITFTDVVVGPDEVYVDSHPGIRDTFPPYYIAPGGLAFASILVGAAEGALRTATAAYVAAARAAGANLTDDADALAVLGRLSARVQSAVALRDQVGAEVSDGFERRRELGVGELVDLIQRTEVLRLYAAGVGLEVGSEIFELPGVVEADAEHDLDRFWRDVRIHSLHVNPRIYHQRVVGDTLLNGSEELGPPFFLD